MQQHTMSKPTQTRSLAARLMDNQPEAADASRHKFRQVWQTALRSCVEHRVAATHVRKHKMIFA
jgi:hypothetical protein